MRSIRVKMNKVSGTADEYELEFLEPIPARVSHIVRDTEQEIVDALLDGEIGFAENALFIRDDNGVTWRSGDFTDHP